MRHGHRDCCAAPTSSSERFMAANTIQCITSG
ncbi:hypothetical protein GMOD_00009649 [Pyrenophora seminiperda CCB06]|uniref:Uncharacterized protein n=1 Tax=Pyrenophora seminiperda CCB06 TaxID=1302712 RepID=A0A3M7MFB0_9PLEO|nr:hypothetical protein GMOD_00009649 [Pyrenophora seminiperda CCB06]